MFYLIIGITGLLVLVALFTFVNRLRKSSKQADEIIAPPAECCGAHAICEKGLKKAADITEYFDDEELDNYKGTEADAYTDEQIEVFRDILYTLRREEISDWLVSLEKRGVELPEILRQEALEML